MSENKMGTMPENRLLITMALPIMVAMLISALYNIVDSIYVAQISENALTAVSLAFPIQMLFMAFNIGLAVGVNAVVARNLGRKNFSVAEHTAGNGVFLALCCAIASIVFSVFGSEPFMHLQTANADIAYGGIRYIKICMLLSGGLYFEIMFERILQATGRSLPTMIVQGFGAILNIILDPILIFGYCGFPAFGIAGAAYATVTSQLIAAIAAFIFNHIFNHDIHLKLKHLRPDSKILWEILRIGLPSSVMASIGSFLIFGLNTIIGRFSSTAVAVLGIYFKIQSFLFMPVFGLNNASIPIIAFNYGAEKPARIKKTVKLATVYAVMIMLFGFIGMQVFAAELIELFNPTPLMLTIGIPTLRSISYSFPIAAVCVTFSGFFQALGHGTISMIVSVTRQLIVILPLAYIISLWGELSYIWWAFPIAEAVAFVMSAFAFHRLIQTTVNPLYIKD